MKKMNKKLKEGIKKKIALISLIALLLNTVMVGIFAPSNNIVLANPVCEVGGELVENGGFEVPAIPNHTYEIYSNATLTSWDVESGDGLEIQNNVAGAPHSGNQHAELDSNNSSVISQEIATFPGANYLLTFWYSPRPNIAAGDNKIGINIISEDSTQLLDETVGDTSAGASTTDWQEFSYDFTAQENITKIVFSDLGISNSLGGYLDDISVKAIQCEVTKSVTVVASKVVCDDESDLPDWGKSGDGPTSITATTAQEYINDSDGKCHLEPDWNFQIGDTTSQRYPGDFIGEARDENGIPDDKWTTFGPTTNNGTAEITVDFSSTSAPYHVREVLKEGYIPFTYLEDDYTIWNNESAELYCFDNIFYYDNFDWIIDPEAGSTYYCVAFNVTKPSVYGPYCGDGVVNQDWEECDSGNDPQIVGCSVQCQPMGAPVCSEDVFARVMITDVQNQGANADMTNDIYLGGTVPTPQGAWFPVYYNGVFMNDLADIDTFQDVPGLAVQRQDGQIRTQIYGTHLGDGTQEHVKGYIEFYNAETINSLVNDTSPNNKMEGSWNATPPQGAPISAGADYAWIDGNNSNFWMTVTVADDGYFTPYEAPVCGPDNGSICGMKFSDRNESGDRNEGEEGLAGWTINLIAQTECEAGDEWADSVQDYSPVGSIASNRSNPEKARDEAEDSENSGDYNFVSLGFGGSLILEFSNFIINELSDDLKVFETSWESPTCANYPEKIEAYASQTGETGTWNSLGTKCLDSEFDLGGLAWAKFVKLVDRSNPDDFPKGGDGFDVDGVEALTCKNQEIIKTVDTGQNGEYCFSDVPAGNYFVEEVMQENWSNTTGNPVAVNLEKGENEIGIDFGNYKEETAPTLGSISGCKYRTAMNGDFIEPEQKLSGWDIVLTKGDSIITETTGETGCYSFDELPEGTYTISEGENELKKPFIQTYPIVLTHEVFLEEGSMNSDNINFGNYLYQCSDGDDNDSDGLIDENDPGCHYDGNVNNSDSYEPTDNNENNEVDPCGDGTCDSNIGENCSTCSIDCGGCGGPGPSPKSTIIITNEKVVYLGNGEALVTWTTNIETTRQVAYGDDSIVALGVVPEYGYDSVNVESMGMTKEHSVTIGGLTDGVVYYFRPIADRSGSTGEKVGKEVFYVFEGEVKGTESFPEQLIECNYLLEYIKLGADNNPVEVEKLERFLNEFNGESLAVNGIYEPVDFDAVSRFQVKYNENILVPWNHEGSTGYVYITTKKMINELYCQREFPLTLEQEAEVSSFAERFLEIFTGSAGASDDNGGESASEEEDLYGRVGGVENEADENKDKDEDEMTEDKTNKIEDESKIVNQDAQEENNEVENEYADNSSLKYLSLILIIIIITGGALYFLFAGKGKEETK